jgi:hypothetical protein
VAHEAKMIMREHMPLNDPPPPRRERGKPLQRSRSIAVTS